MLILLDVYSYEHVFDTTNSFCMLTNVVRAGVCVSYWQERTGT